MIALVDCNSFFCSCERLFRPDLWKRPVGVLSNNDGCFVSRTKELKALGVKMGQPYYQVKELCEKNRVAVFSSNFSLYSNISDRVMRVLASFAPDIAVYSVDEAFLDLSGIPVGELRALAIKIRQQVWREVGVPVSVGIGATKVLAKAANQLAKKDESLKGVMLLCTQEQREAGLKELAIGEIWGVGRRSAEKFSSMGIKTAWDLCQSHDEKRIQKNFTKVGRVLQDELRGIPCMSFSVAKNRKQQIICSRSFGSPVFSAAEIKEAMARHLVRGAEKLRNQKSLCQVLFLFYHTSPFRHTPQRSVKELVTLAYPTQDTRKLIEVANEVVDQTFQGGYSYNKAGIGLYHLIDEEAEQLSLFTGADSEKDRVLMQTIDSINRREGPLTLRPMACGVNKKKQNWTMKQDSLSSRFLTGWSQLKKVK